MDSMEINTEKHFKKQIILLSVIASFVVLLIAFFYYNSQKEIIKTETHQDLKAISEMKVAQLVQWRKERLSEAYFFTSLNPNLDYAINIAKGNYTDTVKLNQSLGHIMTNDRYRDIYMLDKKGKVLYSKLFVFDNPYQNNQDIKFIEKVFKDKSILIRDFYYCNYHKNLQFDILAPIIDNNNVVAVMIFCIDPFSYVYPVLSSWPLPSQTAESYIFQKNGNIVKSLSPLKHNKSHSFEIEINNSNKYNTALKAVTGFEGVYEGKNYEGEKVLSHISKVPGTNWYIASEEAFFEIYSDLSRMSVLVFLIAITAILLVAAAMAWVYRNRQRRIYKELFSKSLELHFSNQELGATLHNIADGVIITDNKGKIVKMNISAENMTGWTEKEVIGKNYNDIVNIISETTKSQIDNLVDEVIKSNLSYKSEQDSILIDKNYNEIPVLYTASPLFGQNNKLKGTLVVISDHTEDRMRSKLTDLKIKILGHSTDNTLSESLNLIINEVCSITSSEFGILYIDVNSDLKISVCNWSKDYNPSLITDSWVWSQCVEKRNPFICNSLCGKCNNLFPEGAELKRVIFVPLFRNDVLVALYGFANKSSDYSPYDVELISSLADIIWGITESKSKEEIILRNELKYRSLINQMQFGLAVHEMVFNIDNTISFIFREVNPGFERLTGLKSSEVIGKTTQEVFETDNWHEKFSYVVSTGLPLRFEFFNENQNRYFSILAYRFDEMSFAVIIEEISEKKELEQKMISNYSILRLAGESARFGGWDVDLKTNKVVWSEVVKAIHEVPDDFYPDIQAAISFYTPEFRPVVEKAFDLCVKEGIPYDLEIQIQTASGKLVWVRDIGKPIRDEHGNIIKVMGSFQDIDDMKNAEIKIKRSEKSYRELIDGMNESAWIIDFNGNLIDVNRNAVNSLGYTKEELLEIGLYGIDTSLTKEMILQLAKTMPDDELQILETIHKSKNGRLIPVEVYSSLINYLDQKAILSIARDVTQRKRDEEFQNILYEIARTSMTTKDFSALLEYVMEKLAKVMDVNNYYVARYDSLSQSLYRIVYVNEYQEYEEWDINKTLPGFVVKTKKPLILNSEDYETFVELNNLVLKNNHAKSWLGVPLIDDHNVFGVLVIMSFDNKHAYDNSSLRLLEMVAHEIEIVIQRSRMIQELVVAKNKAEENDRLKTAFLANISHEIRTPMNGILGFLNLLAEPGLGEEEKQNFMDIMNKSGQRLLDTINDIIEISKIEAGQMEIHESEVNLKDVLDYHYGVFSKMAKIKNLPLIRNDGFLFNVNIIYTDKIKLEGILTNLLNNAVKFTTKGYIEFGVALKNDFLEFYVSDTGMGIPEDKINLIFERFVQADPQITRPYEGSGLGLSIVKAYLNKMGGDIWVESKLNVGSTFYFTIPFKPVV